MNKIYIVTSGSYSDYGIDAVFTTREKAAEYIDCCKAMKIDNYTYEDIEEWDCDRAIPDYHNFKGRKPYFVRMQRDGQVLKVNKDYEISWSNIEAKPRYDIDDNLIMSVMAKDETHATKIVNEKRIELMALNRWVK